MGTTGDQEILQSCWGIVILYNGSQRRSREITVMLGKNHSCGSHRRSRATTVHSHVGKREEATLKARGKDGKIQQYKIFQQKNTMIINANVTTITAPKYIKKMELKTEIVTPSQSDISIPQHFQ